MELYLLTKKINATYNIINEVYIMPNCEFVTFISLLACSIAKDKSPEELAFISAFLVQLRRHLSYTCYFMDK